MLFERNAAAGRQNLRRVPQRRSLQRSGRAGAGPRPRWAPQPIRRGAAGARPADRSRRRCRSAACGLSRRVLDEALLARAAARGVRLRRGHAIVQAAARPRRRHGADAGRRRDVAARARCSWPPASTICAAMRRPAPDRPDDLVGFKLHYRLAAGAARRAARACRGHAVPGRLCRAATGRRRPRQSVPAGAARAAASGPAAPGRRCCSDLRRSSRHLDARLDGAEPLFDRPLTISRVPYGFLHAPSAADPAGSGGWAIRRQSYPRSPATAWRSRCTARRWPRACSWPGTGRRRITAVCAARSPGRCGGRPRCIVLDAGGGPGRHDGSGRFVPDRVTACRGAHPRAGRPGLRATGARIASPGPIGASPRAPPGRWPRHDGAGQFMASRFEAAA